MQVKCFGCASLIEAGDADAAADAFVAHGRAAHPWAYPEAALRNYARNYAEATERLTGDTTRLPEIAAITVHPATSDRVEDWLQLFDHDGFADNPDWASCYCLEPHVWELHRDAAGLYLGIRPTDPLTPSPGREPP